MDHFLSCVFYSVVRHINNKKLINGFADFFRIFQCLCNAMQYSRVLIMHSVHDQNNTVFENIPARLWGAQMCSRYIKKVGGGGEISWHCSCYVLQYPPPITPKKRKKYLQHASISYQELAYPHKTLSTPCYALGKLLTAVLYCQGCISSMPTQIFSVHAVQCSALFSAVQYCSVFSAVQYCSVFSNVQCSVLFSAV